jgi:hypothetical protein
MRYSQNQREGSMMKRISKWLVALAVVFSVSGTFVSAAKSQSVILQVPTHNGTPIGCGSWLEARAERSRPNSQTLLLRESAYREWVFGFLSGVAWQKSGDDRTDLLSGTERAGLLLWLDNYCRANPLDSMPRAVIKLVSHLEARAR